MNDGPWELWAHEDTRRGDVEYTHVGYRHYVELHLMSHPIVPVLVTIDPGGKYWGWQDKDAAKPCLIWPSELLFKVCFPCDPKEKELRGDGRILRLSITRRDDHSH